MYFKKRQIWKEGLGEPEASKPGTNSVNGAIFRIQLPKRRLYSTSRRRGAFSRWWGLAQAPSAPEDGRRLSPPAGPSRVPCFLTSHSGFKRMECKEVWSERGLSSLSTTHLNNNNDTFRASVWRWMWCLCVLWQEVRLSVGTPEILKKFATSFRTF